MRAVQSAVYYAGFVRPLYFWSASDMLHILLELVRGAIRRRDYVIE
jgi:hypothetical protein